MNVLDAAFMTLGLVMVISGAYAIGELIARFIVLKRRARMIALWDVPYRNRNEVSLRNYERYTAKAKLR
jgi:hypothetical protein